MKNGDGRTEEAQSWKQLYEAAMLELDRDELPRRIEEAQKAIQERVLALSRENGNSGPEKDGLADAQVVLDDLTRIHQAEQRNSAGHAA